MGRVREEKRREAKRRRKNIKKRKSEKKERKGRKVAKHCVFPMIWGSGGSKSRLAKAAGAEPAGQMRDEKLHAVVARSTFPSPNLQNTTCSDHFWKLRCRKSAREAHFQVNMCKTPQLRSIFRSCDVEKVHGAKTTLKSKVQKTAGFGAFLDVQMSFRVAGARDCAPGQK